MLALLYYPLRMIGMAKNISRLTSKYQATVTLTAWTVLDWLRRYLLKREHV